MPRPTDDDDDRPRRGRRREEYDDDEDDYDDRPRRRSKADTTGGLIPYNNSQALTAYYLGVFGLVPCFGPLLGPAALVLGFYGLRYVRRHPEASGKAHALVGISLGLLEVVGYVVAPIIFLIAALALK